MAVFGAETETRQRLIKHPKRPRDLNHWAKRMVDIATGEPDEQEPAPSKSPAAVELGQLGGPKGGKTRAESLTPKARSDIAQRAAAARCKR